MKNFVVHDLKRRFYTAGVLLSALGFLFVLSHIVCPAVLTLGVILTAGLGALIEWVKISRSSLKWVGTSLIVVGMASFGVIYYYTGWKGCIYTAGIAAATDTLAYIAGSMIGGPKLCPAISPGKTWSGALTGFFLTSSIGGYVLSVLWPFLSSIKSLGIASLLCLSAQLGDLIESAGKRYCKVKDTGTLLPGHGGVLDRIDSWLMSGITAAVLLFLFPSKTSASPYTDWIDNKGYIRVEKRTDLQFLLNKTGFRTGPRTRSAVKDSHSIPSWHIEDIMKAVQGKIDPQVSWFLPGERWEMKNSLIQGREQAIEIIEKSKNLLHLNGLIPSDIGPNFLIMGCTAQRFFDQILFTDKILRKIDPKNKKNIHIYVLVGPRPLLADEKDFLKKKLETIYGKNSKYNLYKMLQKINSEEEMASFMLKNKLGSGWRAVEYHSSITNPLLLKTNAVARNKYHIIIGEKDQKRGRATTATTVEAWLEYMNTHFPFQKGQKFTIVSNAPFTDYQWQVVENIVKPLNGGIIFNAMGGAWKPYTHLEAHTEEQLVRYASIGLDNLSRLIYELYKGWAYQNQNK